MNGLKFVRKQCNLSLSDFADLFGVSRQIVNMWESGKRSIPNTRKKEMADYFGISEDYFGEINEEQKKYLLEKAMFRDCRDGIDAYRYRPSSLREPLIAYFIPERERTLDEELTEIKQKQKNLLEDIKRQIRGSEQLSVFGRKASIFRGTLLYTKLYEALECCYGSAPGVKMIKYRNLLLSLEAIRRALGAEPKRERDARAEAFISRITDVLKEEYKKMYPPEVAVPQKKESKPKEVEDLTIEERIRRAEEIFKKEPLPEGAEMVCIKL